MLRNSLYIGLEHIHILENRVVDSLQDIVRSGFLDCGDLVGVIYKSGTQGLDVSYCPLYVKTGCNG